MASPTSLELVTLGIAAFGGITGAAALSVQVGQFVLSGPRVKISVHPAFLAPTGVVEGRAGEGWRQPDVPWATTPGVALKVRNVGRLPTSVEHWTFDLGGGMGYGQEDLIHNVALPHRIEPYAQQTWYVTLDGLRAAIIAAAKVLNNHTARIGGRVTFADGREHRARRRASIPIGEMPPRPNEAQ
jgi:hypothetical protein